MKEHARATVTNPHQSLRDELCAEHARLVATATAAATPNGDEVEAARLVAAIKRSDRQRAMKALGLGEAIVELGPELLHARKKLESLAALREPHPFHRAPDIAPAPAPRDGEMWWAESTFGIPNPMRSEWLSDGLHFFGRLSHDDGSLRKASAFVSALFVLSPSRTPQSATRLRSIPSVNVTGQLTGYTGHYHWLLHADDKWSKCWLNVTQNVFQLLPQGPITLGATTVNIPLMNLDDVDGFGFERRWCPGVVTLPPLVFALADPSLDLLATLEVRLDIQLEGDSFVDFGTQPTVAESILVTTPQWAVNAV